MITFSKQIKMNYTKLYLIITVILTTLTIFSACQETIEERAQREVNEFTQKNCPTPIINNSRIDSLTFDEKTRTIVYYRTLFNEADNKREIEENKDVLKAALLEEFRTSTSMRLYIDANFNFRLIYYSAKNPKDIIYETFISSEELK